MHTEASSQCKALLPRTQELLILSHATWALSPALPFPRQALSYPSSFFSSSLISGSWKP